MKSNLDRWNFDSISWTVQLLYSLCRFSWMIKSCWMQQQLQHTNCDVPYLNASETHGQMFISLFVCFCIYAICHSPSDIFAALQPVAGRWKKGVPGQVVRIHAKKRCYFPPGCLLLVLPLLLYLHPACRYVLCFWFHHAQFFFCFHAVYYAMCCACDSLYSS